MKDRSRRISELMESRESRETYIRSKLNVLIPSQIRSLRLRRGMKQSEFGQAAEMKQARISAMEKIGESKFTIETLIRLAAAFRVGLQVRFVSFGEMLAWENDHQPDRFNATPLEKDEDFIQSTLDTEQRAMSVGILAAMTGQDFQFVRPTHPGTTDIARNSGNNSSRDFYTVRQNSSLNGASENSTGVAA